MTDFAEQNRPLAANVAQGDAGGSDDLPAALRNDLQRLHMVPLWESPTAHKPEAASERAFLWPWRELRPIMMAAGDIRSPAVVERRVISLVNPKSRSTEDEATCGAISATIQMLLPGERARPHRHSMNALRFVLEGEGSQTIVDGKPCAMAPGDLILTPAWCWHEHVGSGAAPTIWFDVLDVALHLFMGTESFQPGPARDLPPQWSDDAFAAPGLVPANEPYAGAHSPYFRYPWADVVRALAATPAAADGSRRVRYIDPLRGGSVMPLLDCSVLGLEAGAATRPFRTSASTVCCVVEGSGVSTVGGIDTEWSPKDFFTLPQNQWVSHLAREGGAKLFMVSNRDVYQRLGLLTEEQGA